MNRWLVAVAALTIGGGVSAALLVVADPSRNTVEVVIAARDLPAGSQLTSDALALERVSLAGGGRSLLFTASDESRLGNTRATHALTSGQVIQRSDVMDVKRFGDGRLVFVPIKDAPAAQGGSRVDLLVIGGSPDHPTVVPFALGVAVRASVSGGLVVEVPSKDAAAFVYAAVAMHLAAVIAEPGTTDGVEAPVFTPDQAMATAAQP